MRKEPMISLSRAIDVYLKDLERHDRQYKDAKAFCKGDDKAINALVIVGEKTKVISEKKRDFIQELFELNALEMNSAINNALKKRREKASCEKQES